MMDAAEFGRMIRERRQAARLTQRDLAAAVDTGERFVVDLEAGKPTCQLGKALAVAHALGIRLVDARAVEPPREDDTDFLTLADISDPPMSARKIRHRRRPNSEGRPRLTTGTG